MILPLVRVSTRNGNSLLEPTTTMTTISATTIPRSMMPIKRTKKMRSNSVETLPDIHCLTTCIDPLGQGPAYEATNVKWSRPDIPAIDPSTFKLVFQQIDLDTYADTDATPHGLDASRPHLRAPHTVIRLYGVTDEGYSVMAHLHGYIPYFYASVPSDSFTAADCERFKVTVSQASHISREGCIVLFLASKTSMPPYVVKCEEKMSSRRTSS